MDTAQTLLTRIRATGMSQAAVAQAIGVGQSTIAHLETGYHKDPRVSTYMKLRQLDEQLRRASARGARKKSHRHVSAPSNSLAGGIDA